MWRARFVLAFIFSSACALLFSSNSNADTFDAVTDFSSANPSATWSYGYGATGSSFTPYSTYSSGCSGYTGPCWNTGNAFVPWVASNPTGSTINSGTVVFPPGVLSLHPGPSVDTIVKWTAPAAGTYSISGFFELLDTNPTGIIGEIFDNSTQVFSGTLTGPGAAHPNTVGGSETFSLLETLSAGDIISFGVNNDGNYLNDSTGFNAAISSVPEPSTLTLFATAVLGTGLMHRRKAR